MVRKKRTVCKVGNKYKLTCGVEVEITRYGGCFDIDIQDQFGNKRTVGSSELLKGFVAWPWFKPVADLKVGDSFKLNCGVEVIICEYNSYRDVVVVDSENNKKSTTKSALLAGSVSWKEFGIGSFHHKSSKILPNSEFVTNRGVVLRVIKYIDSENVLVADSEGNSLTVVAGELRRGSVKWPWLNNFNKWDVLNVGEGSYVYCAKYKGELVYVGKGIRDRYRHVNSGRSSCYQLNQIHFSGDKVEVEILEKGLTEQEARAKEKYYIIEHKPAFNIQFSKSAQ